ncbi:MAG: N-acetylmuramoyl-L-alanine amidase, partial [Deltaproteobacteria bacterium]|nr:N-acetylmuramoyl-L-alanine amidase [Deltaproteobacteria bacterium]
VGVQILSGKTGITLNLRLPRNAGGKLSQKIVVIDPGHGGDDQGAVGKGGLKEKDVVLDISLELAKIIRKNTDLEVFLTRDSDVSVKLSDRAAFAREKKADLFISVHANANKNRKFAGVEVYYLNNTDDRASQKVAMLENINSDKSISDLKMTLLDLAISANVDESMRLAQYVQSGIINKLRKKHPDVKDRGVKYALFYVLFGTEIPSILVETSFISNPIEEKRLKTREYRKQIAEGIYDGIMKYINMLDE